MKYLFEQIIRLRNPQFRFDPAVSTTLLAVIFRQNIAALLRSMHLFFYLRNPRFMVLGKGNQLIHLAHIQWGKLLKTGEYVTLNATGKGKIILGDHVSLGAFSRVIISTSLNHLGAFIHIGNNVGIGEFAYLGGGGGLTIGDDCIIGQYFSCHPENHHYTDTDTLIRHQGVSRKGIRIGRNCWIGAKVTICDGVTIGDHCVIAAGAVVTRDLPDYSVAGGVPARIIKNYAPFSNIIAA